MSLCNLPVSINVSVLEAMVQTVTAVLILFLLKERLRFIQWFGII